MFSHAPGDTQKYPLHILGMYIIERKPAEPQATQALKHAWRQPKRTAVMKRTGRDAEGQKPFVARNVTIEQANTITMRQMPGQAPCGLTLLSLKY